MNITLGAAVVGAMASVPAINADELDAHVEKIENKEALNEARSLMQTPAMKQKVVRNLASLVQTIKEEDISLVEIYAAVNTGGNSDVLQKDFSSGFSNSNNGGGVFIFNSEQETGWCHSECHGDCHSNHSSRGWR